MNWKTIGIKVTKKLVYYALVACAVVFLWSFASSLFSEKDTFQNIAGFVLYAVTIGGVFTFGAREVSQLVNINKNKQTDTNENSN